MRATRAIIHVNNFQNNIETVREKIKCPEGTRPNPVICAVVKADAYGHGAAALSLPALEAGASCLAVATVSEGAELRKAGIKDKILLLSQALPEESKDIVDLNLIPLVSDIETVTALQAQVNKTQTLEVHVKVDTGMGRLGCRPEQAAELAASIAKTKKLWLGGMATHFSAADSPNPEDMAYTKGQIDQFRNAVESVRNVGIDPGVLHAANSGAVYFHEDSYFDMVRPGILLYGYSPAAGIEGGLAVKPVMELCSFITFIKKVHEGEQISYGRTWKAEQESFIGTIPIGYADGLPRLLSDKHSVFIRGKAYPLVGRFCMDQCMVDLGTSGEVQRWDEAIIFGPEFENAQTIANKVATIPYEILCNINKRVPRVYMPKAK